VHCLGPAGGGSADRTEWRPARPSDLVPVQALAKRFGGLLLDLVRQERPDLPLPEGVWTTGGGVSGKPTAPGTEQVLKYLGRSGHRLALTHDRLRAIADGQGCFRYQDSQDQRWQTMTLPAHAFIRRLLPHVWPQGVHTVRYDGLWSPVHRPLRHQRQLGLAGHAAGPPPPAPEPALPATDAWCPPFRAGHRCPSGGQGLLVVIRLRPRYQRGPPCAPEPPCGLPLPASSGPPVPSTVAPSPPGALLPETMAGSSLLPHPAALGSPVASGSSPLCPPHCLTETLRLISRMCFPTGSRCLKIPYGLELRFRSTALLWRLRATKTLIRWAHVRERHELA
jgi:Putative transposase